MHIVDSERTAKEWIIMAVILYLHNKIKMSLLCNIIISGHILLIFTPILLINIIYIYIYMRNF